MSAPSDIRTGTLIWVEVSDPVANRPVGPHWALVLNRQDEIDAGADLDVYVVTTSFQNRQPGWFDLPSKPGGHEVTGLDQACVVKATWHQRIAQRNIISVGKRCLASIFKQVQNWLKDKERVAKRRASEPPPAE